MHVYIHAYSHIHTRRVLSASSGESICLYTHRYTHTFSSTSFCTKVSSLFSSNTHTHIHAYTHTHMYICIYTHIHIDTQFSHPEEFLHVVQSHCAQRIETKIKRFGHGPSVLTKRHSQRTSWICCSMMTCMHEERQRHLTYRSIVDFDAPEYSPWQVSMGMSPFLMVTKSAISLNDKPRLMRRCTRSALESSGCNILPQNKR